MTQTLQPDQLTKYIRVTGDRNAKIVEFDFAIHDPTLFVELIIAPQAFQHFCEINHVIEMTAEQQAWNDAQEDKWRYGVEPTILSQAREHLDQEDQS